MLTEDEFRALLAKAEELLAACRDFPVYELMSYADSHRGLVDEKDRQNTQLMWVVHLMARRVS